MKYRFLFSVAFASLFSFSVSALTPEETAVAILTESPQIKEWAMTHEASAIAIQSVANLPDPEIEGEYLFAGNGEQNRWGAGISWGIEWPGVYSARRNEARSRLMVEAMNTVKDIIAKKIEIKQLLFDYILQQKQLDLFHSINALNDSISRVAEKAGRKGELTILDINKLKIERAAVTSQIAEIMDARASTLTSLDAICGFSCDSLLRSMVCEFPHIEIPDTTGIYKAIADSPEAMACGYEIKAMHDAARVVKMESLPGFNIGYKHAFEDDTHFNGASLGISLPIFSSRKKKKAIEAQTVVAEYKALATIDVLQAEIMGNVRRLTILKEQIGELSSVLDDDSNKKILIDAYKKGSISLLDFLNEQKYLIEATQALLTLRHAAASTRLQLYPYFGE